VTLQKRILRTLEVNWLWGRKSETTKPELQFLNLRINELYSKIVPNLGYQKMNAFAVIVVLGCEWNCFYVGAMLDRQSAVRNAAPRRHRHAHHLHLNMGQGHTFVGDDAFTCRYQSK